MTGTDQPTADPPLRIGLLGTARIAQLALIEPARQLDVRLVAVAARDRNRAEEWAAANGVERVLDSYADIVNDPEVEVVYNPLPNSLHAPWNMAAIRAGKHVLTEKPFAANAVEAGEVHKLAQQHERLVFEGFHYVYHPIFARLLELIGEGAIGELTHFHVAMEMPAPPADDLRWSWALAGGALMDLGCYCIHAIRSLATTLGGDPVLLEAAVEERRGLEQIDERATMTFRLPNGALATGLASMDGPWNFSITATGSAGSIQVPNFLRPDVDDRLIVTTAGSKRVEHLGTVSTYTYQLQMVIDAVRRGRSYPTNTADSVATMEYIDQCYRAAGLRPRGSGGSL